MTDAITTIARVEYVARITCACGATAEVPAHIESHIVGGYMSSCEHELSCDLPAEWLGDYDGHPPECPDCVRRRYG